jgi:hypothetical protein
MPFALCSLPYALCSLLYALCPQLTSHFILFGKTMTPHNIILFSLLPILLTVSRAAVAADIGAVPSVSLAWEKNDNIFLSSDDEISDEITTLSGGLLLQTKGPRFDAGVRGNLASATYSEESDLDAVDYNVGAFLSHQTTQRFSWKIDSKYAVDNRPDRDIDVTGLVLNADKREDLNGSFSASYLMGKNTTGALSYDYGKSDYEDPAYSDVTVNSAGLDIGHNLSSWIRETTGHLRLEASRYKYEFLTIDSYSAMLGFRHRIEERLELNVFAGARNTRTEYESIYALFFEKSESWGGVGEITFTYSGKRSSLSLSASRDIRPASGENGAAEQTAIVTGIQYRILRNLTAGLSAGYYLNTADRGELATTDIDRKTTRITPNITWQLTRDISLKGAYTFTRYDRDETDETAERNLLLFTLSWQYDFID